MFLRKIDYISPQITLYNHKHDRHSHIVSGLLTLISYILLLSFSIYFITLLLNRKDPTAYYFNKFENDIGTFSMNSSGLFHFVTVGKHPVDFHAVNIVGLSKYISYYQSDQDLSKIEHWIYGPCEDEDAEGVREIIENYTLFKEGACIKKVWNISEMRYYSKDDTGFYYPEIRHGSSNPNANCFGVVIEKCRNESIFNNNTCYDNQRIKEYILDKINLALYVLDHYIDVGKYKEPSAKFFYKISNGMIETTYSSNQLNFNPALIKTHNGFLFDNIEKEYSYMFDQNAKSTISTESSGILCAFYFWMQNRLQVYERTYKRIQDTCASIGGMTKLILISAKILNYFISYYTIFIDTDRMCSRIITGKENSKYSKYKVGSSIDSSNLQLNRNDKDSFVVMTNNNLIKTPETVVLKREDGKKRSKRSLSFVEFLYYKLFGKISKKEKMYKLIERLLVMRSLILSEDFLFECYIKNKKVGCSENGIPLCKRKLSHQMKFDLQKNNKIKTSSTIIT